MIGEKPKKSWFLEGKLSDGHALLIKIDRFPFTVGRDKNCSLAIASKTISRRHSEIYPQGDLLAVRDLGSTNGTFVNSNRVTAGVFLRDDDTIAFAEQQFRIYSSEDHTTGSGQQTNHLSAQQRGANFAAFYDLSKREEEVLFHLLQGKSTKMISKSLFITEGTAKNHILKIFEKTGAHSRFKLMTMYNKFPVGKKK
ncbi:MAG: FHA domain-containing protein [Spirochaetales bacterium]|nr:FHA domain-containing protein [Spirochaetales bacterium]